MARVHAAGAAIIAAVFVATGPGPASAQLQDCQVDQRVAMPSGTGKWLDAVVIEVNPADKASCRVHPLGYTPYMDMFIRPAGLRAPGSVKMEPIGGIADDPRLLAAQGKKAFKPSKVLSGTYECYAFSGTYKGGSLSPRVGLNFTIVDGRRYRDAFGASGTYGFDGPSGGLQFKGAALDGQRGTYTQTSDPPVKTQPPSFAFAVSGDACDLRL